MRLIDADKLLRFFTIDTANQTYRFGTIKKQIENAETVQAIPIPDNATNGDMVEKIFGKDVYCTLIRMMYSSCCEKLKRWWNAPYKRGAEND